MDANNNVTVHVAVAASSKTGHAAWGAVLVYNGHAKTLSGVLDEATGNAAAVSALAQAVEAMKRPVRITVRTPSKYLADSLRSLARWRDQGWVRQDPVSGTATPIANATLWKALARALRRGDHALAGVQAVGEARLAEDARAEDAARQALAAAQARLVAEIQPELALEPPAAPGLR